ncbi:DNA polymerase alpha/epsilon, subunit B [Kalmanozyma brasiliensis GHG001]|uniref:DNA polymerase alpha subunit B n=1 Tax=Kalmanozyma brasiliensis (strain GHG001) TaxID=1365824 RepID=V5EU77_KALBG|nr:DNA polymerase alpha/epsilon, subunit B [Kalmanozyma brasiliensis GHG001]EST05624.1 DNA polymerase alpha/epsilon, subunit B [Kalmanozyma brasiliensis GHG001]
MVASDLTVRLADHFGPYIASDPSLLTETTSICTHYRITPEDLFYKWEAFAINNSLPKSEPLTLDHARELRKIIATAVNSAAASAAAGAGDATPLKPSNALNRGKVAGDLGQMLGIKSTPLKPQQGNAFQTPVRAASSSFSPFGGPGATPATASAYKPSGIRDSDVHMSDVDSPLRPSPAAPSKSVHAPYTILESLNEHIPLVPSGSHLLPAGRKSRVSLAMATDPKAWNYRYMFEKKDERSSVLDDRIDQFAALLRETYSLPSDEELGDPSLPSQEPIWVVGRICPALPAPESSAGHTLRGKREEAFGLPKLAETGIVLESSRMMGSGNRTPLVFAKGCVVRHTPQDPGTGGAATTLSLFPGQIVLCRGINAGADKFSVSEICFPPPLPLAVHTAGEAIDHSYSPGKLNGAALNVVLASGPFTSESDLDFAPWHRLMDALEAGGLPSDATSDSRRGVPDTLVLTGPFLSAQHPLLPFATELPSDIFARHISTRLTALLAKYPGTMVVLIPSTQDILNIHSAYPQPSFGKEDATGPMGLPKARVRCLPNPSVFYVNELVVGVTSEDALGDLKGEEMVTRIEASPTPAKVIGESVASKNKETNTRWSRSILSQRSFYPLYPPPTAAGLAYDTSHSHLLGFPAVTPDLLVLPSRKLAKPFLRVVSSATVVQPGSVAKGTVVCVQVDPLPRAELQGKDEMESINARLYDRARVDVVAI